MCCITGLPFFLPRLLLGSRQEMHWGLTVHLCFYFPPLGCPCSYALHKSPHSCCPSLNRKLSFPQLFTASSHAVFQLVEAWFAREHPLSNRQLDLCSPAHLGEDGGIGNKAGLPWAWRTPKYLPNCRVFSATMGTFPKLACLSLSTSLGWRWAEEGRN